MNRDEEIKKLQKEIDDVDKVVLIGLFSLIAFALTIAFCTMYS